MRFENPTRWETFLDGFRNVLYAWDSYGTNEFWEALSIGWMELEIYPWDDAYNLTISEKRRKTLDQKPPVIYVSEEAYNKLVEAINAPPQYDEKIAKLLQRKAPWDE